MSRNASLVFVAEEVTSFHLRPSTSSVPPASDSLTFWKLLALIVCKAVVPSQRSGSSARALDGIPSTLLLPGAILIAYQIKMDLNFVSAFLSCIGYITEE